MEELLRKIKAFAEENFSADEKDQFTVSDPEFAVSNPWMDHSGRFPLSDAEAVKEWGLPLVLNFCLGAIKRINPETTAPYAVLYQHGENDFELWQLDMPEDSLAAIQGILSEYSDTGCSVRGTSHQIGLELQNH